MGHDFIHVVPLRRRARPRAFTAVLAVLVVLFSLVACPAQAAPSTTASTATFIYDAATIVLVDVHEFGVAEDGRAELSDTREESAFRFGEDRGAPTTPSSRRVATEAAMATVDDLSGSALSNYNRFVKNLPAAAETPTISNLADGALEFSAKVPATNIPGSYATYTKIVGPDGITTSFIKTTIAPDGSVVSVKVKYP